MNSPLRGTQSVRCRAPIFVPMVLLFCMARVSVANPLTISELAQTISAAEGRLKNLSVTASYAGEIAQKFGDHWDDEGSGMLTAWFSGAPGGKLRINYDRQRALWVGGPVPFTDEQFDDAFNGRERRLLWFRSGSSRNPDFHLRGRLEAVRQLGFNSFATGWGASIYGVLDGDNPETLSNAILTASRIGTAQLAIASEAYGGINCVTLSILRHGNVTTKWYFDPDSQYALKRQENFSANGKLTCDLVVEQLANPSPGIFYPMKSTRNDFQDGRPWRRYQYKAGTVVANDPKFSDDIFTIKWPPHTSVYDTLADVVFTVGTDESATTQLLQDQAADARRMAATAPAYSESPEVSPPSAVLPTPISLWQIMILALILLAGFGIAWAFRHRARNSHLVVFATAGLLIFGLLHHANRANARPLSFAIDDLGSQKVFNSGLNTTIFALAYFNEHVDANKLPDELQVGTHWETCTTLTRIKDALKGRGLQVVEPNDNVKLEDVVNQIDGQTICILFSNEPPEGKFYIMASKSSFGVLLVDSGAQNLWIPQNKLAFFDRFFSGKCLYVKREPEGDSKSKSDVAQTLKGTIQIDAGEIPQGQGELVIPISVINSQSQPLNITMTKGSCNCFKGAWFENGGSRSSILDAKSQSILNIHFDKSSFGVGALSRQVYLQVDDGQSRGVIIDISGNVQKVDGAQVAWLPEKLDFGTLQVGDPNRPNLTFSLMLPVSLSINNIEESSDSIAVIKNETIRPPSQSAGEDDRVLYKYSISLTNLHFGDFRGEIRFLLSDTPATQISIPVIATIK
jgi:hypothetical protein